MKKMKKFHLLLAALLLTLLIPVCKPTIVEAATLKAPKTLTVKQGKNNITINWSRVPGAKGYVVYRKNSPSQGWKRLKVVKAPTLKYLDKNIASGKNYYYTVRPYTNKSGKNSYGSYNKSGRNTVYLKEPKVTATKSHKSVTLKWNKTTGASGYEVYRKSGNSGYSKLDATTALSYTDKNVKPSTKYTYAVRAYKKSGKTTFRSLYYDGANLVDVKTQAEAQEPVEPDPVPDINDAVESKVYFNNGIGILEIHNKSKQTYYNIEYKIDFYNGNTLVWRIPQRSISQRLKPNSKDYEGFRMPEDINYSNYNIELVKGESYGTANLADYIKVGELYIEDNIVQFQVTNTSNEVVRYKIKVVIFEQNIPQTVYTIMQSLNVKKSGSAWVSQLNPDVLSDKNKNVKIIVQYAYAIR